MKNKKIGLVLSLLAVSVFSGCSNGKQAKQQLDNKNEIINAQTERLTNQGNTIEEQEKRLKGQGKVISMQSEHINSLVTQLNAQEKSSEYVVQKGDTLLDISKDNQVSVDTLVSLNLWLKNKGVNTIHPNDVLKLN